MHAISTPEPASPSAAPVPGAAHFQAVVADDAEEGDDGVQHGQDAQRGLHVAAALLQDVVHRQVAGRVVVTASEGAADSGAFACTARRELLAFNHRRSGDLIQTS